VFAVEVCSYLQKLLPGLRRVRQIFAGIFLVLSLPFRVTQDVAPVVEQLRVGVHLTAVLLAAPAIKLVNRGGGCLRVPLREALVANELINGLNPAVGYIIAIEPRAADDGIVGMLFGQEVGGD